MFLTRPIIFPHSGLHSASRDMVLAVGQQRLLRPLAVGFPPLRVRQDYRRFYLAFGNTPILFKQAIFFLGANHAKAKLS